MKTINLKTTLGELIRDEFELDCDERLIFINGNTNQIEIPVKRKQVKDFEWYVNKYLTKKTFIETHTKKNIIVNKCWDVVEFEVKVGLLKFICDDLGITWHYVVNTLRLGEPKEKYKDENIKKLYSICPKDFLESIFK